ncbi:MAG: hypothetical protein HXX13_05735 [Bacteroidetes bacterium]|nr:hypothetical protein [Bacteroidota bacterium]
MMNPSSGFPSVPGKLWQLTNTLVEIYDQGIDEIIASRDDEPVHRSVYNILDEVDEFRLPEHRITGRTHPFDATMISFDRSSLKLTFLISLVKPMRVIGEVYGEDGKFTKHLFDKVLKRGLTEITGVGCKNQHGAFVILLHSNEGMKSFRIRD